jgi:hypothetical protein
MAAVLYYAIPFFILLLVAEYASFRHLGDDDDVVGYDLRDTGTSLTMGIGNVTINVVWKLVVVAIYAALYELTPLRLDPGNPLTWIACSSPTTSPTTGSTASHTRAASSGRATSCTTPRSTTTSRPRCARRGSR